MPAQKKVVLVTGASSGLGHATAALLAERGYTVFGTSRSGFRSAGDSYKMLALDLQRVDSVRECISSLLKETGRLDVLVNNAGSPGPLGANEEVSLAQIKALFETNFFGTVELITNALPVMRKQGAGHIINVSSASAIVGTALVGAYAASKYALEGYTESLRFEVAPFNIHVSMIQPGPFKTNIMKNVAPPENPLDIYVDSGKALDGMNAMMAIRAHEPIEVAKAVHRIIVSKSPRLRYPVGTEAKILATAKRFLPYSILERLVKKMSPVMERR